MKDLRRTGFIRLNTCLIIDLKEKLYIDDNLDISERVGRLLLYTYVSLDLTRLFKYMTRVLGLIF